MPEVLQTIRPEDPAWDALLAPAAHDFYHSSAYHRFYEHEGLGAARLFIYGSPKKFFAWPCLMSPIPRSREIMGEALIDLNSVYGYPGPITINCESGEPFLDEAWRAITAQWLEQSVVSVFSRFHPVLCNHMLLSTAAGVKLERQTVSLDLTRGEEAGWQNYRTTWRQNIKRAIGTGIVLQEDEDWSCLEAFVRLYRETMHRNRAPGRYLFGRDHVEELRDHLTGHISLHIGRINDRLAAAALISEYRGIAQYLYAGVENDFQHLSPLKALVHHVACWARNRGNRVLHLGGGRGARDDDSLFFFKSGFSDRRHGFYTGRWVLDQARYSRLSRGVPPGADFFPAYRAPAASELEDSVLAPRVRL